MPFCPQCGKENPDQAGFCQFCGQAFPETTTPPPPPPPGAGQPYTGPATPPPGAGQHTGPATPPPGGPQARPGAGLYGRGPSQVPHMQTAPAQIKNPILGGFLGFINFGLGAFYNRQNGKGILLLITTILFGGPTWALSPLLGLIFGALFAYDGYKISQRINNGETIGPWKFF